VAPAGYVSFLLRLWPAVEPAQRVWRATLCPVLGEQPYHFASVEALAVFLQREFGQPDASGPDLAASSTQADLPEQEP
jgi:hypothetical protein